MADEVTVKTIVADYLKAHGYEGLFRHECGCPVDDLMPCKFATEDCRPGYLQHHPGELGGCQCIGPAKPTPAGGGK